jgi:hypothetical protein
MMKSSLRTSPAELWQQVGLKAPADPLDAAALRDQVNDDEQALAEHRDEKERLSRAPLVLGPEGARRDGAGEDRQGHLRARRGRAHAPQLGEFTTTDGSRWYAQGAAAPRGHDRGSSAQAERIRLRAALLVR